MLPWVVAGLVMAGGAGTATYFALRRRSPAFGGVPSQRLLDDQVAEETEAFKKLKTVEAFKKLTPVEAFKRLETIGAFKRLETIGAEVVAEKAKSPPRYKINEANGWEPGWLHKATNAKLEWGFCLWDLMEAQTDAEMFDEGRFSKMVAGLIGKTVKWVIDFVKKKTIDISICYRFELPAVRFELADGRSFWIPSEPEGGLLTDIQGWNPSTTRPGFPASLGKWPLSKTPPPGEGGALWIRPLGDLWGWGAAYDQPVEVYQIVIPQDGVLKSVPAMSRRDWRIALMLEGRTPSGGEIHPGGVVKWFKDWRLSGQKYRMRPATRSKAMGFFEK